MEQNQFHNVLKCNTLNYHNYNNAIRNKIVVLKVNEKGT